MNFPLHAHYAALPERFYERARPATFDAPHMLAFNMPLAQTLGLDVSTMDEDALAQYFCGNAVDDATPTLAQAYAGHQFGHFVPQLGDGRALLLGELRTDDGQLYDMQLKGSGRTAFSRRGDGRAPLGAVIREYLVSEAMHALGVPTTRALAIVATGEMVMRDHPLPGGVLTRIAASHVRVGTFEYFAAQEDEDALRILTSFALERHYPHGLDAPHPALALLESVCEAQAKLIAQWMQLGFIHGVMNTDNMTISGQTIDYGPCAFMEAYDPATVLSYIDQQGRYSYGNQPYIGQWNLLSLAQALLPLLTKGGRRIIDQAHAIVDAFPQRFTHHYTKGMLQKIGLSTSENPQDATLVTRFLQLMQQAKADYTLTFRTLTESDDAILVQLGATEETRTWLHDWRTRLQQEPQPNATMDAVNPLYIPRNHLVEQAIDEVQNNGSLDFMHRCIDIWRTPYTPTQGAQLFTRPATEAQRVEQTFCGT